MKAIIPSVPQLQAQTSSPVPPPADRPLSFSNRPDVGRRGPDPLECDHRYTSLRDYAQLLVLRYDHGRTRHAYYRQLRLVSDHFACDPATLSESQVRDYFLHVKTVKHWKPKTIRQAAACARLFFVEQLGHQEWTVFSQIHAHDQARYPAVMTRDQVVRLLQHIRLRRYRTPIKLIYCCGLRLSECLNLTIHDIRGDEGKLWVRSGKGGRDRMVPICPAMVQDLRRYWSVHRHPLLLFPNVGRGSQEPADVAARMHTARAPMPVSSLQRLIVVARTELGLPEATIHTLRQNAECRKMPGEPSKIVPYLDGWCVLRFETRHFQRPCKKASSLSEGWYRPRWPRSGWVFASACSLSARFAWR